MKKRQRGEEDEEDEDLIVKKTRIDTTLIAELVAEKLAEIQEKKEKALIAEDKGLFFGLFKKDDSVLVQLTDILGDIVDQSYRPYKNDDGVSIFEFYIDWPARISCARFLQVKDVQSVVFVELKGSDQDGRILLLVHTSSDPGVVSKYYNRQIRENLQVKAPKIKEGETTEDEFVGMIDAIIRTYFKVDFDVQGLPPVRIGWSNGKKQLLDIHTIGVKMPICDGQVEGLKSIRRFHDFNFGPDAHSNGCLLTFEIYSMT